MIMPAVLFGSAPLVILALIGVCVSMWGSMYAFILLTEGESFGSRLEDARRDRPRLYKHRGLRRKGNQTGIKTELTDQGLKFTVIQYRPPHKDWLVDLATLDLLRPWVIYSSSEIPQTATNGDQAAQLWKTLKQQSQ